MKIALIHHQYLNRGGMERYLIDLVKGFSDCGDEVTLIASKIDNSAPYLNRCRVLKNDVSLIPKPMRKLIFSKRLPAVIDRAGCDLSISVTRSSGQDIAICGGTHRGFLKYMDISKGLLDRLEIDLEEKCYSMSRKLVPHSIMMQEELVEFYQIDLSKTEVIYPPVNAEIFSPELKTRQSEYRDKFGLSNNKKTLLFVSTGHMRKGLGILLKAVDDLDSYNIELAIAGTKPSGVKLSDNCKYLGYVNNMPELYSACDWTILPSQYEPFGLTVIESVQCGTPVIISKFVGAGELLSNKEAVVLNNLSSDCLKESIIKAIDNNCTIEGNFIADHGLDLNSHIESLKSLSEI